MWWNILLSAVAVLLALLQAPLLSGLTTAWSVDLLTLLIVGLIFNFRLRPAMIAAVIGGLAIDALTGISWGPRLVGYLLLVAITQWLFTRVITNAALPAYLSLNAVAFLFIRAWMSVSAIFVETLINGSSSTGLMPETSTAISLGLQLCCAMIAYLAIGRVRRLLTDRFIISYHASR